MRLGNQVTSHTPEINTWSLILQRTAQPLFDPLAPASELIDDAQINNFKDEALYQLTSVYLLEKFRRRRAYLLDKNALEEK